MSELMKTRELQAKVVTDMFLAVDQDSIEALVDIIMDADRIFVAGWGRAGNVGRILGMNMSQLGRVVFCVGDNNTPAITDKDILIICSGSGNTKTISLIAQQAKDHGAKVALMSFNGADSTMGKIADVNVHIPRITRDELTKEGMQPYEGGALGEVFYNAAFMMNDFITTCVMKRTGQTFEDIIKNHNSLE